MDLEQGFAGGSSQIGRRVSKSEPLLLNSKQLAARLGFSKSKFFLLKKAGRFACLEAPLKGYYVAAKVEPWLNGEIGQKAVTHRRRVTAPAR